MISKVCVLIVLLIFHSIAWGKMDDFRIPKTQNVVGNLSVVQTGQVNKSTEFYFRFFVNSNSDNYVVITQVESGASFDHPVTFEVRQPQLPLTWQLPKQLSPGFLAHNASHVVCINSLPQEHLFLPDSPQPKLLTVSVSTRNPSLVNFTILVKEINNLLTLNETRRINVGVTRPFIYHFPFTEEQKFTSSILKISVISNSTRCMTISVQEPQCPVHDFEDNVHHYGFFVTMALKATITLIRDLHPNGFSLLLVLHQNDEICRTVEGEYDVSLNHYDQYSSSKIVEFHVFESISYSKFHWGVWSPVIGWLVILLIAAFLFFVSPIQPVPDAGNLFPRNGFIQRFIIRPCNCIREILLPFILRPCNRVQNFLLRLVTPNHIVYMNQVDAYQSNNVPISISWLYFFIVLGIAVFYAHPEFTHLIAELEIYHSRKGSNHDICYFNNDCAFPLLKPLGINLILSDFFHVYSNIGYLVMGLVSILITWRFMKCYMDTYPAEGGVGINQNFNVSLAISQAIFWEGFLSGVYHFCPNRLNFHTDTCCMYVLASLIIVQIYQSRHAPINHTTFICFMVIVIALDLVAEWTDHWAYFVVFEVIHTIIFVLFGNQLIHLDRPCIIDQLRNAFKHCFGNWKPLHEEINVEEGEEQVDGEMNPEQVNEEPVIEDRVGFAGNDTFVFIVISFLLNVVLAVIQYLWLHAEVGTYLLYILLGNAVLYFLFYALMKVIHGERFHTLAIFYMVVAGIFWGVGIWRFMDSRSRWENSPSRSRELNRDCEYVVYDSHDSWHFASALALFCTVNVLLYIDVDLWTAGRDTIPVF